MATTKLPEGHVEVDWSKWAPPGEGDVRSPCPAINALANHSILPHSGKNISKAMAVSALTHAFNFDPTMAALFAMGGIAANPDHSAHTFDLDHVDKHNWIEHDVSLSRDDVSFGSNSAFCKEQFGKVMQRYKAVGGGSGLTSWRAASEARWERVLESKGLHEREGKVWGYGIKEAVMSYGESALLLSLLGKDGAAPLEWVRVFVEEERLPYGEGWRAPAKFGQTELNHGYAEMFKAHPHAAEEARLVGIGTLEALRTVVVALGAGIIKSPFSSKVVQ